MVDPVQQQLWPADQARIENQTKRAGKAGESVVDVQRAVDHLTLLSKNLSSNAGLMQDGFVTMQAIYKMFDGNQPLQDWLRDLLPSLAELYMKESDLRAGQDVDMWKEQLPTLDVLRLVFFSLRDYTVERDKLNHTHVNMQKRLQKIQDNIERQKSKRMSRTEKGLDKINAATKGHRKILLLARRNQYNRKKTAVKKPRVDRTDLEEDLPPLREHTQRLTIFQKLEIMKYARSLLEEHSLVSTSKKRLHRKTDVPRKRFRKGMNLQALCKNRFGATLGSIKVCQLLKAAKTQMWEKLTVAEQKKFYLMPDKVKVAVGLSSTVRGWKSLGHEDIIQQVERGDQLRRWNAPGAVMKAENHMQKE